MEEELLKWYKDCYVIKNQKPTSKDVKTKAKEICNVDNFNASKGWLEKFKLKHKLELVRAKRTEQIKLK